MSVNTVETFLYRLGNDRAMIESFARNANETLAPFPLSDEERRSILEWDLHTIVESGVSPMALMFAYMAVHGGPEKARDKYIRILKAPRPTRGAGQK